MDPLDPEPAGGSGDAAPLRRPEPLGWRQARQALIAAGACPLAASEVWVANHYRWIVWKLAAHTRVLLAKSPAPPRGGGGGGAPHLPPGVHTVSVKAAADAAAGSCGETVVGNYSGAAFSNSAAPGPHLAGLTWHEVVAQLQYRWGSTGRVLYTGYMVEALHSLAVSPPCCCRRLRREACGHRSALTCCPSPCFPPVAGCAERPADTVPH